MSVQSKPPALGNQENPRSTNHPLRSRKFPPQLIAWLVLLLSFSLFCLLAFGAVSLVTDYLSHSVQTKEGRVQRVNERDNNVFVRHSGQSQETLVNGVEPVKEGDEIRTDKNSEAVVYLFDDTRLDLSSGSQVLIEESRIDIKNFRRSEKRLAVKILDGQVRITVPPFLPGRVYNTSSIRATFPPDSPGGFQPQVLLNDPLTGNYVEGSFTLSVALSPENGVRAWINNKSRKAVDVQGSSRLVPLGPGQRVAVERADPGVPGLPSERQVELVANGSFINGIDSWSPHFEQGPDYGDINGLIQFDAERIDDGVQPRLHIARMDPRASGNFAETSLSQEINRDVSEYEELWFSLKVKLVSQSLAGGGQQGSEYPFFVKIYYVDKAGNQQEFFRGFYYKPVDSQTQVQDQLGRSFKLSQDEWWEERFNLMDNRNKPVRILRIIIGSSGHLYDSYCTDVSLVAR